MKMSRLTLVVIPFFVMPLCAGGKEKETGEPGKAAHDALAKFDKGWNSPPSSLRPLGDGAWKVKVQALKELALLGSEAEPVLMAASKESSPWSPWTRQFAEEALKLLRDLGARSRLRDYDLTQIDAARLGRVAPDFSLTDISGNTYRLSDFRGKKNVALVFVVVGFG